MPPNRFESEVESFLEGSHGDRTHIKRADHHTVTPLCGTLLSLRLRVVDLGGALYLMLGVSTETVFTQQFLVVYADGDARSG